MATQQSIDHLVGLAVAMLGVAPGTKWLNERAKQLDGGDTLADIANEIQSSTGFEGEYPAFLTNERFATDFLEALLGDHVTEAIMMASVDFVAGQLAGATRGELALALVERLTTVAREGADNALHADFGKAAAAFHNKVMVAKHYTEEAREADPSASVLEGVTDDPATVMAAKDAIDNPPAPPESMEGQRYVLTPTIDDIEGTDFDDTIVAQPVQGSNNTFQEVLNPFDSIDGGGGADTIHIFGTDPNQQLRLGAEDIRNVENVVINTVGGIDADLGDWAGLEMVTLERFGRRDENTVEVTVNGAVVTSERTFERDVEIIGAKGEVNITASDESAVVVGSGEFDKDGMYTEMVMVKGGKSVTVAKNAAGAQSATVTKVVVDGVARAEGEVPESEKGMPADESGLRELDITFNDDGTAQTGGVEYVVNEGNTKFVPVTPVQNAQNTYYIAQDQGKLSGADGKAGTDDDVALEQNQLRVTTTKSAAAGYKPRTSDGDEVVASTVNVHSNAIEAIQLHNTKAIAVVKDESKMADGKKGAPAPLSVAVEDFNGELRLQGAGVSDDVTLTVVKDSGFKLTAGTVKTITVGGEGKLTLTDGKAINALQDLILGGKGKFTMDAMGMAKLKTVDASKARDVMLTNAGGSLEMYTGGGGKDHLAVTALNAQNGLTVDLGADDDHFSSTGAGNAESSISGGAGRDTLHLTTAVGAIQGKGEAAKSIYSGFEVLDVGGSVKGTYDIELLDVGEVTVSRGTNGAVTLKNMGSTQGFSVGTTDNEATAATIVHQLRDREPGTSRNDRTQLEVELDGGSDMESINLTLTTDSEIRDLVVSSKTAGIKTATKDTTVANTLTLEGTPLVEELVIDGNAKLTVMKAGARLDYVDASGSTGGVVVDASSTSRTIEMFGGAGVDDFMAGDGGTTSAPNMLDGGGGNDMLTGGSGVDTLMGGAGMDTLNGGTGNDNFVFTGDSRSLVTFKADGTPKGHDTIMNFEVNTDLIHLGKGLLRDDLVGSARDVGDINVNSGDPTTLKAFLDAEGDGLFEDRSDDNQVIRDTIVWADEGSDANAATWIFVDVNGNGDWDGEVDMAIKLMSDVDVTYAFFATTLLT